TDLMNEIHLFSSEPVAKAAGEIAAWVLLAKIASTPPPGLPPSRFKFLEDQLEMARKKFFEEALPTFRAAIRDEAGVR
ncbi:MAG: hypothetical protein ACRD2T_01500, partial [Thermoanaerobaculia bacterium]